MTSDKARKSAVRAQMAATGEPYCVAARTLDQTAPIPASLLRPYEDERDVATEDLGWRVLPADATPAQRARAEATWHPVSAERPCRCSGPCHHGRQCVDDDCSGTLEHIDRVPGSVLGTTDWFDIYECDLCGKTADLAITLPDLPWGRWDGDSLEVFPDVRHPSFRDAERQAAS